MFYVKVNETLYPATINGRMQDGEWDNRESKAITLEMDYATAIGLFVDGLTWSIIQQEEVPVLDENGEQTGTEMQMQEIEDCGEFEVAGSITDNRNGTITAKMGKFTAEEALAIILGGKA